MAASFLFYYTGASGFLKDQTDSSKSLGGYISDSIVGNQVTGNIFGDISALTKVTNKTEYRVVAIKNTGDVTATNVQLDIIYPQNTDVSASDNQPDYLNIISSSLKVGYLVPSVDACGDLTSEQLPTIYSKPNTVTLQDASTAPLILPNIAAGSYICLYFSRTLNPAFLQPLNNQFLVDVLNGVATLQTQEDFDLQLHWS